MISLEDRQALAQDIHIAHTAEARLKPACAMAGIELRTFQRWQASDGLVGASNPPIFSQLGVSTFNRWPVSIYIRRRQRPPVASSSSARWPRTDRGRTGTRAGRGQRTPLCGGATGAHYADAGG